MGCCGPPYRLAKRLTNQGSLLFISSFERSKRHGVFGWRRGSKGRPQQKGDGVETHPCPPTHLSERIERSPSSVPLLMLVKFFRPLADHRSRRHDRRRKHNYSLSLSCGVTIKSRAFSRRALISFSLSLSLFRSLSSLLILRFRLCYRIAQHDTAARAFRAFSFSVLCSRNDPPPTVKGESQRAHPSSDPETNPKHLTAVLVRHRRKGAERRRNKRKARSSRRTGWGVGGHNQSVRCGKFGCNFSSGMTSKEM